LISFEAKYYILKLMAIVIAGIAIVMLLYFRNRDNNELSKNQLRILMLLRLLSFVLIALLLLIPFLRSLKKTVQNPKIILAYDNSASMTSSADSTETAEKLIEIKNHLTQSLDNEFSLVQYSFGRDAKVSETIDFKEKGSDYSKLITTVSDNHYNENIGALVLIGDGTYNMGKNPVNMMNDITFPVYTIGFGDTTEVADALIRDIRVNRTAFSGNQFPVEIDCSFLQLKEKNIKLSISHDGAVVDETMITPASNDYFHSQQFILDAGSPGLKTYFVNLGITSNERNLANNEAEFIINVLEYKQKILILSDGPHPDIGAIRNTLEQQQSFDVTVFTDDPYPLNLSGFNLVILNQLPTPGKSMSALFGTDDKNRIPLLFILGSKTYLPQLNTFDIGVNIQALATSGDEAQAIVNDMFGLFNISEELRGTLTQLPPLRVSFANYRLEPEFNILLYQQINNIETNRPLLAAGIYRGRKTGFIFGEGLWKWRLYNYLIHKSHDQFSELVNQLLQYLALRENEDNFMVSFESVYSEVEDVIMKAEVYNDAFEIITNEEINIVIENEEGNKLNFTFDVTDRGYILNAGNLPVGNYHFTAEVSIGNDIHREEGYFRVTAINLENIITKANHRILFQMAVQSGGGFFTPEELDELTSELKNNNNIIPVISIQEMMSEILNLKGLFFVLLVLLSSEWLLRKYWGLY
jgi:hypothetical protein